MRFAAARITRSRARVLSASTAIPPRSKAASECRTRAKPRTTVPVSTCAFPDCASASARNRTTARRANVARTAFASRYVTATATVCPANCASMARARPAAPPTSDASATKCALTTSAGTYSFFESLARSHTLTKKKNRHDNAFFSQMQSRIHRRPRTLSGHQRVRGSSVSPERRVHQSPRILSLRVSPGHRGRSCGIGLRPAASVHRSHGLSGRAGLHSSQLLGSVLVRRLRIEHCLLCLGSRCGMSVPAWLHRRRFWLLQSRMSLQQRLPER